MITGPLFRPIRRFIRSSAIATRWVCLLLSTGLAACAYQPPDVSSVPLQLPVTSTSAKQPAPLPWIRVPASLPPLNRFPKTEGYSFKLKKVPAISVLEALADSEGFSFEGDECAQAPVNLFLKDVSALQAIEHMAHLLNLQLTIDEQHITLSCNKPYWVTYKLDYPAVERTTLDTVTVNSQLGNPGTPGTGGSTLLGTTAGFANSGGLGNNASVSVQTKHQNRFWDELTRTIEYMLIEPEAKELPAPVTTETVISQQADGTALGTDSLGRLRRRSSAHTNGGDFNSETTISRRTTRQSTQPLTQVLPHAESGLLMIKANQQQHAYITSFLETVTQRALKQVLIEATVAEVRLSSQYQKGIQWQALPRNGSGLGFDISPITNSNGSGVNSANSSLAALLSLRFVQPALAGSLGISAALSLLEQYGDVRVISNPKLAVLNQQTAVLKVVDNRVYFTVQVQTAAPTNNSSAFSTFTTQLHTVPVGFFMAITPHIEDHSGVSLTIRPTVSRILGFINDPNPALAQAGVVSRIPEIQTREIESVMRLHTGEIALLGGLMQTSSDQLRDTLPGAANNETARTLLDQQRSDSQRSELVILLRPVIEPVTQSKVFNSTRVSHP